MLQHLPASDRTAAQQAAPGGLASAVTAVASTSELKSNDAYMLIYTQDGRNYNACVPGEGSEQQLPEHTRCIIEGMQQAQAARAQAAHERRVQLRVRPDLPLALLVVSTALA